MDFLFPYWLHIILKTQVFLKPLAHISHQRVLFYNLSNICPTFIREGTPKGLKTTSTGVPSCK
ncbi:hypothetical protein BRADI_1g39219v3 [Brachypodium distachyon]|uniref:Uncharacterized protein n=1 Tax=Brachypodium distachyon TaxID=15368 RepID=A0A0Q3JKL8_BRADI|nr:hypothetical protein BRADI_1g39219v3 [Brachypodium distachyon]